MTSSTGQYPNSKGHKSRTNHIKQNYPSRFAARKALFRRLVLDWVEMGTYPCTSGVDARGGKLHYHFGHSTPRQRYEGWKALQRWRFRRLVQHPYYEGKRRVRYLFTGKIHSGAHIKRG